MATKIKICGLTNLEDAQLAVDSGADMLGFILYPKSPRYIAPQQLKTIIAGLNDNGSQVLKVGVFVNEDVAIMKDVISACGLDAAQLHGEEPAAYLRKGQAADSGAGLAGAAYKAIRPATPEEAEAQAGEYALPDRLRMGGRLPALLVDTYHPKLKGGTGIQADRDICTMLSESYPILLAGGHNPSNVREAVQAIQPWGIDVSSGIEASPGKKDHRALIDLIAKVKS